MPYINPLVGVGSPQLSSYLSPNSVTVTGDDAE